MSTDNEKVQAGAKKRPLLVVLFLFFALLAGAAVGYFGYQLKESSANLPESKEKENKSTETAAAEPIYFPLETFTVSLQPAEHDDDRVLYIGITLRLKNQASRTLIEKYLPEIRSRLLRVFSQQNASELAGDEGKALLVERIKTEVSKPLYPDQKADVTDVLFNAFILR